MKLKSGDMLVMDVRNGALSLQLIGRGDAPRVEKKGRGWSDGATVLLKGADVAEFLDALDGATIARREIGDSGLSVEVKYDIDYDDCTPGRQVLVLFAEGVSVELTWPERTLLMCAIPGLAWRLF